MPSLENVDVVNDNLLNGQESAAISIISHSPDIGNVVSGNNALHTAQKQLEGSETDPEVIAAKNTIDKCIAGGGNVTSEDDHDKLSAAFVVLAKSAQITLTPDEIRSYENLCTQIVFDASESHSVSKFLTHEKGKQLTTKVQTEEFYTEFVSAFIAQKYGNDRNDDILRTHMQTWFLGAGKQDMQATVTTYFTQGLQPSDGGRREDGQFTSRQVSDLFDKRYDLFRRTPLTTADAVEKEEISFKKERLEQVSLERVKDRLGLSDEVREVVETKVQPFLKKQIKGLTSEETGQKYGLQVKNAGYIPFSRELNEISTEIVAAQNRSYILGVFAQADGIDAETKAQVEIMLDNTSSYSSINAFAQALNEAGDQQASIVGDVLTYLQEKGEEKTYKFGQITLEEMAEIAVQPKPGAVQVYLPSTETVRSFDTYSSEDYLDGLLARKDILEITLTVPAEQASRARAYASNNEDANIQVFVSPGAYDITINATESKEVQSHVDVRLDNLAYNQIGDLEAIGDLLEGSEMGHILKDPTYTITGGTILGSASRVRTAHQGQYVDPQDNSDIHNHITGFIPPQNSPDDDVTNNPSLTFDRAVSFLDYLLSVKGKVPDTAKFGISTEINGPTNAEMNEMFGGPSAPGFVQQRADAAKEFQYATLSLDLVKKVPQVVSKTFQPTEEPLPGKLLTVTARSKPERTASSPRVPSKNPIPGLFDAVKGIFGNSKVNYSKCPSF